MVRVFIGLLYLLNITTITNRPTRSTWYCFWSSCYHTTNSPRYLCNPTCNSSYWCTLFNYFWVMARMALNELCACCSCSCSCFLKGISMVPTFSMLFLVDSVNWRNGPMVVCIVSALNPPKITMVPALDLV